MWHELRVILKNQRQVLLAVPNPLHSYNVLQRTGLLRRCQVCARREVCFVNFGSELAGVEVQHSFERDSSAVELVLSVIGALRQAFGVDHISRAASIASPDAVALEHV